ncbi:MAG: TRAP transporter small permease [Chloroflexi bacterium]|nr:TRAP transporter small permease [Chloroflexota bacterium]
MQERQRKTHVAHQIRRLSARVQDGAALATGIVLLAMLFMIAANTLLRYGFNTSWNFTEEYTAYGLIFMTFVPLAWTLKEKGHISIDIFVDRMPDSVSKWVKVATGVASLAVVYIMFYYALKLSLVSFQKGLLANTYMLTPLWIPQTFITVGLLLFLVEIIFYIGDVLRGASDDGVEAGEESQTHG